MMAGLIHSYDQKEEELHADKERYKTRMEDLVARNKRLHAAHMRCREQVLNLAPRGQTPELEDMRAYQADGGAGGEIDEDLTKNNEEKSAVVTQLRAEIERLQEAVAARTDEMAILRQDTEDLKQDVHRSQFELDNKTVEFEAGKVD